MNTPVINHTTTDSSRDGDGINDIEHRSNRRRPWMLAIAAAAVAAIASTAIIVNLASDGAAEVAASPLELSVNGGNAMASCMVFDVSLLADMSPAFAATATVVDDAMVTLTVDRWYAGGDADTVVLHSPDASPALIAGFEFVVGERYLITAAEGNVNFCGYSGIATPELTAAFDAAFPG